MIDLGLYEKVYIDAEICTNGANGDYDGCEWDSESQSSKYYNKEAIDVTDEEYDKIRKIYMQDKCNENTHSKIGDAVKWIGVWTYCIGFITGFIVLSQSESFFAMFSCLWISFVSGTLMLGLYEIIRLLNEIKKSSGHQLSLKQLE